MSLPERKKSAEEIARLREQMGLPGGETVSAPSTPPAETAPEAEPRPVSPPKPVRSLRRSERLPIGEETPTANPTSNGGLPVRRRSEQELEELRRREGLRAMASEVPAPVVQLQAMTAHWSLVTLGYLAALVGAFSEKVRESWYPGRSPVRIFEMAQHGDLTQRAVAWLQAFGPVGLALLIALFVAWRYPRSRHHAGFIAVVAGLVLVFDVLYYFPNLNPAHAP